MIQISHTTLNVASSYVKEVADKFIENFSQPNQPESVSSPEGPLLSAREQMQLQAEVTET